MLKKHILTFFFVFLVFAGFSFSATAQTNSHNEPEQYVQVRLIADQTNVKGGETIRIGLEHTIYPKWHIYWKNPGDSGTPPQIQWNLPEGFKTTELEFPVPKKLPYGPLTNYGHEGQVILLQDLTIPEDIGSQPITLKAEVDLLVCHEICIPESHDVWITLNGNTPAETQKINAAENLLPSEKDWPATYMEEDGNFIIKVVLEDVSEIADAKNLFIAPEDWGPIDNNADAAIEILDTGFRIIQKRGERDLSEISALPILASYTHNGEKKSFRIIANPENPPAPIQNSTVSMTIIQAVLFAILGGIILNLMPCVFPVLSMKALSLVSLQGEDEKKARAHGISYTAGILASFGLIAALLLLLKAGGSQIGWGFQLQNPAVIIALTYLVFLIGLNLSGFFELPNRLAGAGQNLTQKSGHTGSFFTGVLATLVATPCTAPFMGAAMGFALTQPAAISMLVFLTLGFGLALPYLLLCYIPALRSKLPKPGHWMETFRQFLAFPMFITTAWLVWVLSQQVTETGVLCVLIGLIAIAFTIWLMKIKPEAGLGKGLTLLLAILTIGFVISSITMPTKETQTSSMQQGTDSDVHDFTPARLSNLLAGDDPVFTNMTAAWCITCKVNEKVALKNEKAIQLFMDKNIQYLKGDWTNKDPDITNYLNSFGRTGVPLYVYYGPRDSQSGERPEPVVLPQILTLGVLEKALQ